MRIPIRRPSPALVISCVALAIALGGTSYATVLQVPRNSVGPAQLKTAAVTNKKIAANAVNSAKVQNGSLVQGRLPVRLACRQAPPAPQALRARPGRSGLSGVERVETTSANTSTTSKSVFLACPTGKRLIGGGARVTGGSPRVAILTSYPDNDNIWRASAAETTATASNWTLTVYSICATTS